MKTFLSIYFWTAGFGYALFVCLFGIICSLFLKPEKYDPWIKSLSRGIFKILHSPVVVQGNREFDKDTTYLFMGNHLSLFDVPFLQGYIPTFIRGVEAKEQFRWPLYGLFIQRMGNIPIDRKNIHASIRSIRETLTHLHKGRSIVILPEGHRTMDGKLRPFKNLPFYLAKEANVDLVPFAMSGLYSLKSKNSWLIHPLPLKMKFGNPISKNLIAEMSVEELKNMVRDKIHQLVEYV